MKLDQIHRKVRVAHVGASADPNSTERKIWGDNDRWYMDSAFTWLYENGGDDYKWLYYEGREDDLIDLNDNRDFLLENTQYDIVILHMIYSPPRSIRGPYRPGQFAISHMHTRDNWRRRLQRTGAKYIFTFGDDDEVSGQYLGPINGYEGPIDAGNYLSVHVRRVAADAIE